MDERNIFAGDGEMERIIRGYDWSSSPLGPIASWPEALKTAVRIMLTSRFPMWMAWGNELTFLYNETYARVTMGKKHPWGFGKPTQEVWSEIWTDIGPLMREVLDTGRASWFQDLLLFLERSGFREETYHTFSYSPLSDEHGRVMGMLSVVSEDTERVLGERQLSFLRRLSAELSTAISEEQVTEALGRSLRSNQKDLPFTLMYLLDDESGTARLFCQTGFGPGHPLAAESIALGEPDGAWPISKLLDAGELVHLHLPRTEASVPAGDWQEPPTHAALVPITRGAQERPAGFLVVGLNPYRPWNGEYAGFLKLVAGQIAGTLTNVQAYEEERKRAEALAEIDRAKTTFFSNVSHELRTPLTLMLGPLEDHLASNSLEPGIKTSLDIVHRNGLRLLKLVNTLLEFSRVEAGRVQARFRPVDLSRLTRDLASTFRSAVERGGVQLITDCPPLILPAYVDVEMWEKIVLNLLSNAFKSTFQGSIAVRLREAGQNIELSVVDTGTGIPEQEIPHLFERFRRVEGARRRTHEGTGIGLALVQELVRMHGGTIGVQTAVGVGTTFTVRIPSGAAHLPKERVHEAETESEGGSGAAYVQEALSWLPEAASTTPDVLPYLPYRQEISQSERSETRHARVLLVDDNRDMRDYVSQLLRPHYQVEVAENGRIAFDAALRHTPDLILTDVMMPEMNGFELLAAVRQSSGLETVR